MIGEACASEPALPAAPRSSTVDVGAVDAIPLGEGRAYRVGGRAIAVFRPRGGGVFALEARCPHRGGPLADGIVGGGTVVCPLHGWSFDLASGQCAKEGAGVRAYPTLVRHGRILVVVEAEG